MEELRVPLGPARRRDRPDRRLADHQRYRSADRRVEEARIGLSDTAGGCVEPGIGVVCVTILTR